MRNIPPYNKKYFIRKVAFLFRNYITMASSKTFQEKLVSKDSLQKKYQELAKLSETPLITS